MRRSKRGFLSLLLTLALVLTMLPTTALAVDAAPVDTTPDSSATAPEETPDAPADDAGEPEETPDEPEETPDAPADDAGEPEETPDAPADDAGEPEETPDAPAEEPAPADDAADKEPVEEPAPVEPVEGDPVTDEAANQVLDSGPVSVVPNLPEFEPVQIIPDDDFPDNDELFAGYVESVMYGDDGIALFGTVAGDNLSGLTKTAYDALVPEFAKIANGTRTNTQISVPFTVRPTDAGFNSNTITNQNDLDKFNAYLNTYFDSLDANLFLSAILADCPYDLYWFDKTTGYNIATKAGYIWGGAANQFPVQGYEGTLTFSFAVAQAYAAGTYTTNAAKTSATTTSVNNAKAIVTKYAGETEDYKKLLAYKNEICNLVSYDHDAAENVNTPYGDPWQLIYVFDGNSSTNVVCEGYAKAFQYLCDLSSFTSSNVLCYTVTGPMGGGTGAGPHMWNVVRMDNNKNYIVDVTNCDDGSIGAPDDLFLAGVASSDGGRTYTFPIKGINITFSYDADMKDLHVPGWLVLDTDYYPMNQITLAITGGTAKQKTFDGLTVGDVTEVTFKNVEDDSVVPLVLDVDYVAIVEYTSPNAGTTTAKIRAKLLSRQYKLQGADANGIAEFANITTPEILKANALMKVQLSTNQQKRGKSVDVKVIALHETSDLVGAQPKQVTIPDVTLTPDNQGAFNGVYNVALDAPLGKKTFTATLNDANFNPLTASADLEILDKGPVTVTLTADKTSVTYGDTVAVTAKVAKTNADDTDTLAGTFTLYLGTEKLDETTDLTKELTATLDKAKLKAGTHTLKAEFVPSNNFFAGKAETAEVAVAQKTLDWDVSGITVAVRSDADSAVFANPPVQGELAIAGVLDDDDVKLAGGLTLTAPAMTETPAEQKLTLTINGTPSLTGAAAANYKLLDTKPVVTATVNKIEDLVNPEEGDKVFEPKEEPDEGTDLKLEMEVGISYIPQAVKDKGLDTPVKVINTLITAINMKDADAVHYDVELKYSTDGGKTWNKADDNKYFPLTVTLPYPDGTTSGYTFKVAHMFTSGDKAGTVETPSVTNTANGLKFTVTSLSPISVAWTEPTYSGGGGGGGSNYSGDVWEKIEKKIEEADKGDRIEAKVYDDNMPVSTMQALYDDGGVTLVIKYNDGEIIIPAGKALNPKTEAGRIYYPLSYLAELYKGSKIPSNGGNPETGGVWVITAPTYTTPVAPTPATPEPAPAPEAVEPAPEPETPVEIPTATAPVTQPEASAKESSKVGTIVALLALMAAAAAGAWLLWKKRDDDGLYTK